MYVCLSLSKAISVLNGKFSLSNAAFIGGIVQYNDVSSPSNFIIFTIEIIWYIFDWKKPQKYFSNSIYLNFLDKFARVTF